MPIISLKNCTCGIQFEPKSHNHIYCSSKCRRRERTKRYRARKKGVSYQGAKHKYMWVDEAGNINPEDLKKIEKESALYSTCKEICENPDKIKKEIVRLEKKMNVSSSAYEFTCGCDYIEGEYCCPECGAIRRRVSDET